MRERDLRDQIFRLMDVLPPRHVTTYGDLAVFAGHPGAARIVGGIAHRGPDSLPWHRLVHSDGRLAVGFPGGVEIQQQLLAQDGITCELGIVSDFTQRRWKGPTDE